MTARFLVVDANVLIDFVEADPSVLTLVSKHLGQIHVLRAVLDEVEQLDQAECERLQLKVVDGTVEQLVEAAAERGQLSFEDRLCMIVARDGGWICVSNDKPLRTACGEQGVQVWWGLEMMAELVEAGHLEVEASVQVAEKVHDANPRYITKGVLLRFKQRVGRSRRS